jgi:hypothetical protein
LSAVNLASVFTPRAFETIIARLPPATSFGISSRAMSSARCRPGIVRFAWSK